MNGAPGIPMKAPRFSPGIVDLLRRHLDWLDGRRGGLVSHLAAVDAVGATSAELLKGHPRIRLTALLGPEHGFFGIAGAGEQLGSTRHSDWRIPIFSLYGASRRPTSDMMAAFDVVVLDLQDLGARPYTYVATLRGVLEAAAECGTYVVVADRPVPLPRVVDGPMLEPDFGSFVGSIPAPMQYGMTPGETARWLRDELSLRVELRVAAMGGYRRQPGRDSDWPPWIPPSPGIRSWESARCYLATVFSEALPAIDVGRSSNLAFQLLGNPWMKGPQACEALNAARLPGVLFHPHPYSVTVGPFANRMLDGVRLTVTDPARFRPVLASVSIVSTLQSLLGRARLWKQPGTRPEFFDKLYGTSAVREALLDAEPPQAIARGWRKGSLRFRARRKAALLYATE